MLSWLVLAASLLLCLVLLYLDGRRRERAVLRDWELALTPKGERALRSMEHKTSSELALVDLTYTRAREAQDIGHKAEALRLLDVGCRMIEEYCPTMLRSLAAMAVLSRMVAAMAPVSPMRPRRFELRPLTNLAYLNRFIHHFLVTTAERFRLKVYILARGFETLGHVVIRSTSRVKEADATDKEPEATGQEWRLIESARHDVHSLSQESLETFRVLLVSMAAERRE